MRTITHILIFCLFVSALRLFNHSEVHSQEMRWRALPTRPNTIGFRVEDIFFLNESTGWAISINSKISKTTNGGFTWVTSTIPNTTPRTISFINENTGWVGLLDSTAVSSVLLQTTNGGTNWTFVNNIDGPRPGGLCGMRVVNDSVIVIAGRVRAPAYFVKTTNAGVNWISKDMSQYNYSLIDCYFFSPDSGFAIGGVDTTPVSKAQILFTSDGGENWVIKATGSTTGEWGWKLFFPTRNIGYASIQNNNDSGSVRFYKTIDGGMVWEEKLFLPTYFFEQGVGFLNPNTGWIGGDTNTYATTDGGESWYADTYIRYLNKIRFINDSIGFAGGDRVYKYSSDTTVGIIQISTEIPSGFSLGQNYPNPFNPSTKINYSIRKPGNVRILIYDITGKEITRIIDGIQDVGSYSIDFDGSRLASGVYFYKLETDGYSDVKKMVLMK